MSTNKPSSINPVVIEMAHMILKKKMLPKFGIF